MKSQIRRITFPEAKWFWIIVIIGIVVAVNIPFLSIRHLINTDEFTSLAVPAYYAGHDWSDFVSTLGFHGYGFTVLFTPIFSLLHNSIHIYKFIMIGALILRILMALITFGICESFFSLSHKTSTLISLVCELGTLKADDGMPLSAMTELPFAFIMLVSALFFLKGMKSSGRKKRIYFGWMCFFMAYGYFIHSRSIVMWFSAVVVIVLYLLIYRVFDKHLLVCIVLFVFLLFVFSNIDSYVQNVVYKAANNENLKNSINAVASTRITNNLNKFLSPELLKTGVYTFVSLLGTLTLYSGGIIWFVTAINISALYTLYKNSRATERPLMALIIYSIVSFYVMNASIAMNSTGDVISGRNLRWLTYIRYCKPFGYLLVLCALICLFRGIYNKLFVGSFCLVGLHISLLTFCTKTIKHLVVTQYGLSYSIFNRIWYNSTAESVNDYFRKMILICLALTTCLAFWGFREKKGCFLGIYIVYSLLISGQNYNYYADRDSIYFSFTDGTSKITESLLLENSNMYYGGSNRYALFLRWKLYEETLLYQQDRTNINLTENSVYFTDLLTESQLMNVEYIFLLDENEYIFTSDSAIAFKLENAGYKRADMEL